ncbi:hypothetical protein FNV43_RR01500 [Rhamnella rubrinervis]|uniref:C2H2-type domain-containing protein n=1 Tax=Rhamnella rubrinervis TaxID=2594499 RepID=A0A8K0MS34_9ROSA|nr:hypothetical protein FNV43_RR01500 [Rhamnella rubrinervis]
MERKNMMMNNSLKDHGVLSTRAIRDSSASNNMMRNHSNNKSNSSFCNNQSYEEDYMNGFSWPPRSYTCSFCKREFRSAQALGGHMNVHRKDRARLRQLSPPPNDGQYPTTTTTTTILNLNLKPNPNPNFSSSSSSSFSSSSTRKLPPFTSSTTLSSLICSPPPPPLSSLSSHSSASPAEKWSVDGTVLDPSGIKVSDSSTKVIMRNEKSVYGGVRGLQMGLAQDDHVCKNVRLDLGIGLIDDSKEDLDLELRLGYS